IEHPAQTAARVEEMMSIPLFVGCRLIVGCGAVMWFVAAMLAGPETLAAERPGADDLQRYVPTEQQLREGYRRSQSPGQPRTRIYKSQITPHWFQNNTRLWYRNDL